MSNNAPDSPAAPSFPISWPDTDDDITKVWIRYIFSPFREIPSWTTAKTIEMKRDVDPVHSGRGIEKARIPIPDSFHSADSFFFHSLFIIERRVDTPLEYTDAATDEIVCDPTFAYLDMSGAYTHVCIKWTVDGWRSFTWTPMEADGMDDASETGVHHLYECLHGAGDPNYFAKRAATLQTLLLPRIFRGRVFARRGTTMDYCFHLLRKTASTYTETWDNNAEANYQKVIRPVSWEKYPLNRATRHTVSGNIRRTRLRATSLSIERDIWVYLPPEYHADTRRRFPVIYMNDGQNLFDNALAFAGTEWGVDETMNALSHEGIEAIVVAVENGRSYRTEEFTSFARDNERGRPNRAYLDFLVQTVDPAIRNAFRTRPGRRSTGIVGASFGGLISLAAFFSYPNVFGFCASLSNWMWITDILDGESVCAWFRRAPTVDGTIYLDYVQDEEVSEPLLGRISRERRLTDIRKLVGIFEEHGFDKGKNLRYCELRGFRHCEQEWGRRLPNVIRWLGRNNGLYTDAPQTNLKPK